MEYKNIVATIYLKDGQAVRSHNDETPIGDIFELCELYNDSGIDKLIIFDLSDEDAEHEQNIRIIQDINRKVDIKVCAGGNIRRMDDVQKLMYAGCLQVILNGSKPNVMELALETSKRFGKDRVLIAVKNVDFIFKNNSKMEDTFHELLLLNSDILDSVENITSVPHVVTCSE